MHNRSADAEQEGQIRAHPLDVRKMVLAVPREKPHCLGVQFGSQAGFNCVPLRVRQDAQPHDSGQGCRYRTALAEIFRAASAVIGMPS